MSEVTAKAKANLVLRSLLFVPVNIDKYVVKAHTRGADAIILDLEDSIASSEKATARTLVTDAAKEVSKKGADVFVRINSPLRLAIPDLEAVIGHDITGITLPKCDGPGHVRMIAEVIAELEAERGIDAVSYTHLTLPTT